MTPEEREKVVQALKKVYDPEIPINIVDLGLIRDLKVEGDKLVIKIVMTAPGCPYQTYIIELIRKAAMKALPEFDDVIVEVIDFPPWTPFDMTPEAREEFKKKVGYDIMQAFLERWGSKENYYQVIRRFLGLDELEED